MMNSAQILAAAIRSGAEKVHRTLLEKAVLGFIGGAAISFGFLLDIRVIASVATKLGSLASFIGASVFPIGLIICIMAGGELVTSNMTAVPLSFFAKKIKFSDVIANYIVITIFNLIGAIFVAYVFGHLVGLTAVADYKAELLVMASGKIHATWYAAVLSGVGCNWFVGLAFWMATGAKDAAGKLLAIWFPIMTFVAIGFQHSIANAFLIPAAIFEGGATWAQFFQNFLLVWCGNILGALIFVAGFYTLGYKRPMNEQKLLD